MDPWDLFGCGERGHAARGGAYHGPLHFQQGRARQCERRVLSFAEGRLEGGGKTKALVEVQFLILVPAGRLLFRACIWSTVVRGLLYCQVEPDLQLG